MKNIWDKHKTKIILLGYILAILAVAYFAVIPFEQNLRKKSDKIQETSLENEILERKTSKLSEMENRYIKYQQDEEKIGEFIKKGGEVDFIRRVESLAEETGNVVSLKIGDGENQDKKAKSKKTEAKEGNVLADLPSQDYLTVEINLEGNYENLIDFVKKLENLEYYLNIVSLDLAKGTVEIDNPSAPLENIFRTISGSNINMPPEKIEKNIVKSKITAAVYFSPLEPV